ncbi:MAG: signal peptidase I [Bacilli bacterium]|nr:signal peptidase I [Bacilli bacterium]
MKKFLKEYVPYIVILVLVILTRTFLITPVKVNGSSMDKTLKSGDIMLLYKQANIDREDIVVIDKAVQGSNIIKRIIGMPGETIKCEDGIIYINNKVYNDKYAYGETNDFKEVTLSNDEYFVLGDNRMVSQDSRYFGSVKEKYIEGQTSIIIYPFNKIGKVS